MWGKKYMLQMNCYYRMLHNLSHTLIKHRRYHEKSCKDIFLEYSNLYNTTEILTSTLLGVSHQAAILDKSTLNQTYQTELTLQSSQVLDMFLKPTSLISHIYYTESDQLLYIDSVSLRNTLLAAANMTTHIIGRRVEKKGDTDPTKPFENLIPTRAVCGNISELYYIDDNVDYYVRRNESLKWIW